MPRIPTSKPQDVRSRPSVGGQVNISSQDGFFKSIAAASSEAGAAIEKAQIEKQQLIDVKEANEVAVFQSKSRAELDKRLTEEADVTKHEAIIDEWADNTVNLNLRPGVSNLAKEKLQQNNNLFIQNSRASFIAKSTETAYKQARETAAVAAMNAIEEGDEAALEASYDSNLFSPVEQRNEIEKGKYKIRQKKETDNNNALKFEQESLDYLTLSAESLEDLEEIQEKINNDPIYTQSDLGKRIKSLLEQGLKRRERTLVNRDESLIKTKISNEINVAQNVKDLNEIYKKIDPKGDGSFEGSGYSEKLKQELIKTKNIREKSIVNQTAQALTNEIENFPKRMEAIASGEIESIEAATEGFFDPEISEFLIKSYALSDGTKTTSDPEFLEIEELMNREVGYWGALFTSEAWRTDTALQNIIKRIENFVIDPDTSMGARFAAVDLLVSRAAVDNSNTLIAATGYEESKGPDGETVYSMTGWEGKVVFLDDFQSSMIKSVSADLNLQISKAAEKGDWTKSLLSPSAILQIHRTINNELFLSRFKKSDELKTNNDLSEKIQEEFYGEGGIIQKHFKTATSRKMIEMINYKKAQAKKTL